MTDDTMRGSRRQEEPTPNAAAHAPHRTRAVRVSSWRLLPWAVLLPLAAGLSAQEPKPAPAPPPLGAPHSYASWKAAVEKLPSNRALRGSFPPKSQLALPEFRALDVLLDGFFAQSRTGALAQASLWLGETPTRTNFFNTAEAYFVRAAIPFQPFTQKLVVPEGTEIIFHGDLHGDVRSLMAFLGWLNEHGYLREFTLARPDVRLVFLGDYTDRGAYGTEVLYTLLRLKLANPEGVVLVRGNHEDVSLAMRYGFLAEASAKYGRTFDALKTLRAYDFLPVVLYLGCGEDFIQCNHGGLEPGYDPRGLLESEGAVRFQFLGALRQRKYLAEHPALLAGAAPQARATAEKYYQDFRPETPTQPSLLGFMWNDFSVAPGEAAFALDPDRSFVYGETTTKYLLANVGSKTRRVHAVFRAHQHAAALNPMMRRLIASGGVFRHWQTNDSTVRLETGIAELRQLLERGEERAVPTGSVWTFNVTPDSAYGEGCGFTFDTFGILKTARSFADWRLRVVNLPVKE